MNIGTISAHLTYKTDTVDGRRRRPGMFDYIILEELEKMRRREQTPPDNRLYLELPLCPPDWKPREDEKEDERESERGVIIIQM